MDILDILLDILLKPPQPFIGLFLQFSEHAENFNMLFYSFQHSFSICFQHALQISTCSEIFNTLSNMKI